MLGLGIHFFLALSGLRVNPSWIKAMSRPQGRGGDLRQAAAGDGAGGGAGQTCSLHSLSLGNSHTHWGVLSWRSGGWELSPACSPGLPLSHAPTLSQMFQGHVWCFIWKETGTTLVLRELRACSWGARRGPGHSVRQGIAVISASGGSGGRGR